MDIEVKSKDTKKSIALDKKTIERVDNVKALKKLSNYPETIRYLLNFFEEATAPIPE